MSRTPSHRGAPTRASEQLLRSARTDHAPSSADRERVRRALARRLAEEVHTLQDATMSNSHGLLHPLAKTGIGLVLLAAGITTLMRSTDHPKSVAVKPPQSSELQPGEPAGGSQVPGPAAEEVVEPGVPALQRTTLSSKRAAPRSKAALRAVQALEGIGPPAASSFSAKGSERMARDDVRAGTQPAAARVSSGEQNARAAHHSVTVDDTEAQVRESKPATPNPDVERAETPAARAHDASADGREELAFLARVRAELTEKEHEHVLELCDEHKLRWPHGMFAQEREGLRAIAMCETENERAANNARAFSARYPQSPMAPRVRAACSPQLKAVTPR